MEGMIRVIATATTGGKSARKRACHSMPRAASDQGRHVDAPLQGGQEHSAHHIHRRVVPDRAPLPHCLGRLVGWGDAQAQRQVFKHQAPIRPHCPGDFFDGLLGGPALLEQSLQHPHGTQNIPGLAQAEFLPAPE
jgi:hypothetical protein